MTAKMAFSRSPRSVILLSTTLVWFVSLSVNLVLPAIRKWNLRRNLPPNLEIWRFCVGSKGYLPAWDALSHLLARHGLSLWRHDQYGNQGYDGLPEASGYAFLSANRKNHSRVHMGRYGTTNGIKHAARSDDKRDFILRIMTAGGQGEDHLRIVRRLSRPPDILHSNNHILPMVKEIVFEDVVIGVFPRVMYDIRDLLHPSCRNSVEDILYIILQALEGVVYIHEHHIVHLDLFLNNFIVEWSPNSLDERGSMARPRVYLIDFETAVELPEGSLPSDTLMTNFVMKDLRGYNRPIPPELANNTPQNPYKVDMWQMGIQLQEFYPTGQPEVDKLWDDLASPDPRNRPTASEALARLDSFLRSTCPSALHVRSLVPDSPWYTSSS